MTRVPWEDAGTSLGTVGCPQLLFWGLARVPEAEGWSSHLLVFPLHPFQGPPASLFWRLESPPQRPEPPFQMQFQPCHSPPRALQAHTLHISLPRLASPVSSNLPALPSASREATCLHALTRARPDARNTLPSFPSPAESLSLFGTFLDPLFLPVPWRRLPGAFPRSPAGPLLHHPWRLGQLLTPRTRCTGREPRAWTWGPGGAAGVRSALGQALSTPSPPSKASRSLEH